MCSSRPTVYRSARNHCKTILENPKCSSAQAVQANVESKQFGSRAFWKISN